MNREQKPAYKIHILEAIWREICSYYPPEAGGQDRGASLNRRLKNTHRKLLKTERLQVFHFGAEWAFFRQALDWRKRETLWVV